MKKENELSIENMFLHIGNLIRCLLNAVSQVYEQNKINYSVSDFHQKIMRILAPPCELLKLNEEDSGDWIHSEEEKPCKIQQPGPEVPQMLKMAEIKQSYKPDPSFLQQVTEQRKNSQSKEKKKKFFPSNNPTGVDRDVKNYEKQKGFFFKKSLKVMRHVKKFTENYEDYLAQKNDPNKTPKRKTKLQEKKIQQQKSKPEKPLKKGRKLVDEQLEQRISIWAKLQLSKGRKLRKVDIRNRYNIESGGKSRVSSGWCRRFLERHPQILSWFKRSKVLTQVNRLAKTEEATENEHQWLRPGQQGELNFQSTVNQEDLSSSQLVSQSFQEGRSIEEYEKSNLKGEYGGQYHYFE